LNRYYGVTVVTVKKNEELRIIWFFIVFKFPSLVLCTYITILLQATVHQDQVFLVHQWNRFGLAEVAVTNKALGLATFGMLVASSMRRDARKLGY
jgi:hypothetical protein